MKRILCLISLLVFAGCAGLGQPVRVVGTIGEESTECVTLRTSGGKLYSLANGTRRFYPGDKVEVEGRLAVMTTCPRGETIIVKKIHPAARNH